MGDPGSEHQQLDGSVVGCVSCDLLSGSEPLPGGHVLDATHWVVFHVRGPWTLGSLAVVPRRHVIGVGELHEDESTELGRLLQRTAAVVAELTDSSQVYTCQWSHHDGQAAHIHFICQPILRSDMARFPGQLGPMLQAAIFQSDAPPEDSAVETFVDRARIAFTEGL